MKSITDVERYWDERPCNIKHSNAPFGTLEYFESVRSRKYKVEPHIIPFADFWRWDGANILEIGCGIGTDTIEFASAGATVTAVDISSESLKVARLRAERYDVTKRITFVHANAETLSLALNPLVHYDLIYSFGVLHHTPNPLRAFDQIAKFVGDDTHLKFMLYNKLSAKALSLTHARLWRDDLIAEQSEAQSGCPVTYSFTPWGVRRLLNTWFDVMSVRIEHIFPYQIGPYKDYTYEREWWANLPLFAEVEHLLGWHLLIDAKGKW